MIRCKHCGDEFARRTTTDRYCVTCEARVAAQVAADERRRTRFSFVKDTTGAVAL